MRFVSPGAQAGLSPHLPGASRCWRPGLDWWVRPPHTLDCSTRSAEGKLTPQLLLSPVLINSQNQLKWKSDLHSNRWMPPSRSEWMFPLGATSTFCRVAQGSQLWGHFANKATHAGKTVRACGPSQPGHSRESLLRSGTLSVWWVFFFWFWGKRGCCLCLLVLVNAVAFIKHDGRYNI